MAESNCNLGANRSPESKYLSNNNGNDNDKNYGDDNEKYGADYSDKNGGDYSDKNVDDYDHDVMVTTTTIIIQTKWTVPQLILTKQPLWYTIWHKM